ncbi:MAG: class I SAM-dependent rRNA methyltransferase [Candidatus Binatia bacterium]
MSSSVVVGPRGAERAERGHPWIYQSDITEIRARGGDVVEVFAPRGRKLGEALYSDRSQIALRLLTRGEERFDAAKLADRLDAALAFRERLGIDATAYRLVHGEADRLPSLIVDRYGGVLVVQALSQGMDRLLGDVVSVLGKRLTPAGILTRHDANARALEGLPQTIEVLRGTVPPTVAVRDRDLEYEVDPYHGQKTGLFLDQRENRWAAAAYAGGRALDCFSYDGGFSFALARPSTEVVAVEVSEQAAARLATNANRNRLANVRTVTGNVFDVLRDMERRGERFGTIVLDPPAFAKTRASLPRALGAYKEINLRALKILDPGGTLVSCSCSYHVSEPLFLDVVQAAARDARATLSLLEKRTQARDHPVLLGVPETNYLKCLLLRKL